MDRQAVAAVDGGFRIVTRATQDIWITVTDLRRHFHAVLREVERGATFTIVRRGRPVARLVPAGVAEVGSP